jgi:predicted flap endonuclease-1-like 5' DNA nuclease
MLKKEVLAGPKVINWNIGGIMTITKTDDKVTKPETDKNKAEKAPEETSKYAKDADNILKALTSDKIGELSPLGKKSEKSVHTESIVTEEINRIKQLMK